MARQQKRNQPRRISIGDELRGRVRAVFTKRDIPATSNVKRITKRPFPWLIYSLAPRPSEVQAALDRLVAYGLEPMALYLLLRKTESKKSHRNKVGRPRKFSNEEREILRLLVESYKEDLGIRDKPAIELILQKVNDKKERQRRLKQFQYQLALARKKI